MELGGTIRTNLDLRMGNVKGTAGMEKTVIQSTVSNIKAMKPAKAVYGFINGTAKNLVGQGNKFMDANSALFNGFLGKVGR